MASKARQLAQSASAPEGRKNIIINGAMQVAQRATSVTGIGASSGYFTVDRFKLGCSNTAGRLTMTQTADGPSGFANCIKLDCTTADTSIDASEFIGIQYRPEGQDLQRFMKGTSDAKEYNLSFYVKGNASATYAVELFDFDNSRQVSKLFSVTTDWTRVEITYPADTTGAFDDDNEASMMINIFIHAGSNFTSGTLNETWASSTNANRAVGISSFFDSTDRTFFITGVQLEVGSVATEFETRSFGEELSLCQRYYFAGSSRFHYGDFPEAHYPFPTTMRTNPTVTLSAAPTGGSVNRARPNFVTVTGMTTNTGELSPVADAEL